MNKKHQTLSKPSKIIKSDDFCFYILKLLFNNPNYSSWCFHFTAPKKLPIRCTTFLPQLSSPKSPPVELLNLQLLLFLGRTLWALRASARHTAQVFLGQLKGFESRKKTPKTDVGKPEIWRAPWNWRVGGHLWFLQFIPTEHLYSFHKLNAAFLKNSRKGLHGFTKRHSQVRYTLCDAMMQLYIPLCELCVTINHQNKHQHQRTPHVRLWQSVLQYYCTTHNIRVYT